jgi:hypothetical protein
MSSNKPGARRCCPVVGSGTTIRWSASGKDDHLVLGVSGFREGGLIGGDARLGWHVQDAIGIDLGLIGDRGKGLGGPVVQGQPGPVAGRRAAAGLVDNRR